MILLIVLTIIKHHGKRRGRPFHCVLKFSFFFKVPANLCDELYTYIYSIRDVNIWYFLSSYRKRWTPLMYYNFTTEKKRSLTEDGSLITNSQPLLKDMGSIFKLNFTLTPKQKRSIFRQKKNVNSIRAFTRSVSQLKKKFFSPMIF